MNKHEYATAIAMSVSLLLLSAVGKANQLTIGSKAPPIDIEHWISDKEPIADFEPGKVYVVEFWATWCGPCIASIPHLRDLQLRHGDDVMVISVSDEPRDTIEQFLERERNGTTYKDLTSSYWLTTDPDGSVKQDYMRAAGQSGIPTAFIVGKAGEIEWIGHPMNIDDPVARILAGTWDREVYERQRQEQMEVRNKLRVVFQHTQKKQFAQAMAAVDALLEGEWSPGIRGNIEATRRRVQAEAAADAARAAERSQRRPFGEPDVRRLAVGDQVTLQITGRTHGPLWGDLVYTLDSDLGTAAVHAGLLRDGQTKAIKVWIVPSPGSFAETSRNGIQSRKWGSYHTAFIMQDADSASRRSARP